MKAFLIHGAALVALESEIVNLKKEFNPLSVIELFGKHVSFINALSQIATVNFFADKRLVILEDFNDISDLSSLKHDTSLTLVLKYRRQLPPQDKILKLANDQKITIKSFNEDQEHSVFPFLDMLIGKNPKAQIELKKLLIVYGSQYLLTMIFYSLRRLIYPSKKLSGFALKKLHQQQEKLPLKKISQLYKTCLEIDFKIKLGLEEQVALKGLVAKFIT